MAESASLSVLDFKMKQRSLSLEGQRFGMLIALCRTEKRSNNNEVYWLFKCDCGVKKEMRGTSVKTGRVYNCGCLTGAHLKTHGKSKTRTYNAWACMRSRTTNPKVEQFHNYGGRGIKVCERWDNFSNFLKDMGECPPRLSLDRIDVNGNYEPSNCRWATSKQQGQNTRKTIRIEIEGKLMTINELSTRTGFTELCIYKRYLRGWIGTQFFRPLSMRGGQVKRSGL